MILFAILASAETAPRESKYNACFKNTTPERKLACFADKLPELSNARIDSPFLSCVLACQARPTESERDSCITKCSALANPSEPSQNCLLSCGEIKDPVHQSECINSCRSVQRINAARDVGDACKRCRLFAQFLKETARKVANDEDLDRAVASVCAQKLSLLPICQAITKRGFENLREMVRGGASFDQICQELELCH